MWCNIATHTHIYTLTHTHSHTHTHTHIYIYIYKCYNISIILYNENIKPILNRKSFERITKGKKYFEDSLFIDKIHYMVPLSTYT